MRDKFFRTWMHTAVRNRDRKSICASSNPIEMGIRCLVQRSILQGEYYILLKNNFLLILFSITVYLVSSRAEFWNSFLVRMISSLISNSNFTAMWFNQSSASWELFQIASYCRRVKVHYNYQSISPGRIIMLLYVASVISGIRRFAIPTIYSMTGMPMIQSPKILVGF